MADADRYTAGKIITTNASLLLKTSQVESPIGLLGNASIDTSAAVV